MKRHTNNNGVFLAMFALREIKKGIEIRYDYGDAPSEMIWRSEVHNVRAGNQFFGYYSD